METFKAKIRKDSKGECYIIIPKTLSKKYGWKLGDDITISYRKKNV